MVESLLKTAENEGTSQILQAKIYIFSRFSATLFLQSIER